MAPLKISPVRSKNVTRFAVPPMWSRPSVAPVAVPPPSLPAILLETGPGNFLTQEDGSKILLA